MKVLLYAGREILIFYKFQKEDCKAITELYTQMSFFKLSEDFYYSPVVCFVFWFFFPPVHTIEMFHFRFTCFMTKIYYS